MSKVPRVPPATLPPSPPLHTVAPGTVLWRLVSTTGAHRLGWNQLRRYGPVSRFDPHPPPPTHHPGIGAWYASDNVITAFAEVFQTHRRIITTGWRLVGLRLGGAVDLLNLSQRWVFRAGASAALGSCDHRRSQAWARAFHDHLDVDGVWWRSAIDPRGHSMVLWQRAASQLDDATLVFDHLLADRHQDADRLLTVVHRHTGWPVR